MLEAYPSLTEAEFCEACNSLERRCHDNLSDTDWLSIEWTGKELKIVQRRSVIVESEKGNSEGETNDDELQGDDIDGDMDDDLVGNSSFDEPWVFI